jgi:hypothetical protein
MQNFHYHILKTNKELCALEDSVREILERTGEKITLATEWVQTDVVVRHNPQDTIPEIGISGRYTKEARCIDIYFDVNNPFLNNNFETEVARTFIHEYMHVVREQYIEWENGTLLDSLIAEGLTQSFEIEIQPDVPSSIYATAFTEAELDYLWNKAKDILDQRGWINDEWFFGGGEIKRWSGYSLGFRLVQDKIKSSGMKASELYKLPSRDFLNIVH